MSKYNKILTNIIKKAKKEQLFNKKVKVLTLILTLILLLLLSLVLTKTKVLNKNLTNQPLSQQNSQNTYLTVAQVIDGDTIKLEDGTTVRYININTPELEKGENPNQCFALEAKKINQDLVLGKKVRLELDINHMDHFGRTLAYVFLKPNDQKELLVNEVLLEKGAGKFFLDTVNLKYQDRLIKAADQAHSQKKGLWQECAQDKSAGCQIKGNLDRLDHKYYHLPSFRHYSQTQVNLKNGDQWFCTEKEAQEAGFKKARE
jgi:micrococcal nuclease